MHMNVHALMKLRVVPVTCRAIAISDSVSTNRSRLPMSCIAFADKLYLPVFAFVLLESASSSSLIWAYRSRSPGRAADSSVLGMSFFVAWLHAIAILVLLEGRIETGGSVHA